MTQAYNLSQLANNLNSSGQLDATDGLVNAVPVANGGTGASTASAARTNLSVPSTTGSGASGTWAIDISGNAATATNATNATSATTASSVTNGVYTEGNQTINGIKQFTNGVKFGDGTTQTTAVVLPTSYGAVGTYAILMNASNVSVDTGGTVSGSNLRYNYTPGGYTSIATSWGPAFYAENECVSVGLINSYSGTYFINGIRTRLNNSGYDGGGTALSGTWRKVSNGITYRAGGFYPGTGYSWAAALYLRIS